MLKLTMAVEIGGSLGLQPIISCVMVRLVALSRLNNMLDMGDGSRALFIMKSKIMTRMAM